MCAWCLSVWFYFSNSYHTISLWHECKHTHTPSLLTQVSPSSFLFCTQLSPSHTLLVSHIWYLLLITLIQSVISITPSLLSRHPFDHSMLFITPSSLSLHHFHHSYQLITYITYTMSMIRCKKRLSSTHRWWRQRPHVRIIRDILSFL